MAPSPMQSRGGRNKFYVLLKHYWQAPLFRLVVEAHHSNLHS